MDRKCVFIANVGRGSFAVPSSRRKNILSSIETNEGRSRGDDRGAGCE